MERIYILHNIFTSENNAKFKGTKLSEMYPHSAGSLEGVTSALEYFIAVAKAEGYNVEEITSSDVHKGQYFDRVVKIQRDCGGPSIWGISSVWKV